MKCPLMSWCIKHSFRPCDVLFCSSLRGKSKFEILLQWFNAESGIYKYECKCCLCFPLKISQTKFDTCEKKAVKKAWICLQSYTPVKSHHIDLYSVYLHYVQIVHLVGRGYLHELCPQMAGWARKYYKRHQSMNRNDCIQCNARGSKF